MRPVSSDLRKSAPSASIATPASARTRSPTRRTSPPGGPHQGMEKTSGAGYYFHIDAKEVIIVARSVYAGERSIEPLSATGSSNTTRSSGSSWPRLALRKASPEFEGNVLSRPPKGFPKEHPALDLIQCRQWGVSATLPSTVALNPGFAAEIIRHFRLATPVVEALNSPLLAALMPAQEGAFWTSVLSQKFVQQKTVILSDRSVAKGVEGPAVAFRYTSTNLRSFD